MIIIITGNQYVTILVLVEYSLQYKLDPYGQKDNNKVTILVLVEYSLQFLYELLIKLGITGHNPCFSRILFAMDLVLTGSLNSK